MIGDNHFQDPKDQCLTRKRSSELLQSGETKRDHLTKEGSLFDEDLVMKRLRSVLFLVNR